MPWMPWIVPVIEVDRCEAAYAADCKEMALDDACSDLAHRLMAEAGCCEMAMREGNDHSERCRDAYRQIRQLARILAGYGLDR